MIEDFLKTEVGVIIISIIWGLGLATLFKKSCKGDNCTVIEYRGPPVSNNKHSWRYDGNNKCYKWIPYLTSCKK